MAITDIRQWAATIVFCLGVGNLAVGREPVTWKRINAEADLVAIVNLEQIKCVRKSHEEPLVPSEYVATFSTVAHLRGDPSEGKVELHFRRASRAGVGRSNRWLRFANNIEAKVESLADGEIYELRGQSDYLLFAKLASDASGTSSTFTPSLGSALGEFCLHQIREGFAETSKTSQVAYPVFRNGEEKGNAP